MRRLVLVSLLILETVLAAEAAAECGLSDWLDVADVSVECSITPPERIAITIPFEETYMTPDTKERRVKALNDQLGKILLEIEYDPDLAPEPLVLTAENAEISSAQIIVTLLGERRAIRSVHLTFPPGSLFCEDELVDKETSLEVPVLTEGESGEENACSPENEASRPLDWKIDAAPADDDAEDDPGLAVNFSFDKEWGYNLAVNAKTFSWSTNLWRLKLDGSGTTNEADFHDSVTADFSWSWSRTYLDLGQGFKRKLTSTWLSAYARPETTFDDDVRDYVFGGRVEALAHLKNLIGTDFGTGTRPYLALGFETVDPDKREDGTAPDNYERATADFLWKFSPYPRIRVEVDWEAKYIVDKDDLAVLGLEDRLQDKLDLSVALDISGQREFTPFLTYTRGAEAPTFEVVEEILFGLVWDRLFQGEAPQ